MSRASRTISLLAVFIFTFAARSPAASTTRPTDPAGAHDQSFNPLASLPPLFLDDDDDDKRAVAKPAASQSSPASSSRYFFGLLDNRSLYGRDFFPDLFLGPNFDQDTQVEVDYFHAENHGTQENEVDADVDWNAIGQLTLSGEFGWDSQHARNDHGGAAENENGTGIESVDLGMLHPIFQFVSTDETIDYTAAARLDFGIPTRTPVSGSDLLVTPYLGHLLRVGSHISFQAWTGAQFAIAPHQTTDLIYGANVGYEISRDQLALPLTDCVVPMVELDGQRPFSSHGQDALFGVAGFEWSSVDIAGTQPQIAFGYQFPIDQGASDELRWGIVTQFTLNF